MQSQGNKRSQAGQGGKRRGREKVCVPNWPQLNPRGDVLQMALRRHRTSDWLLGVWLLPLAGLTWVMSPAPSKELCTREDRCQGSPGSEEKSHRQTPWSHCRSYLGGGGGGSHVRAQPSPAGGQGRREAARARARQGAGGKARVQRGTYGLVSHRCCKG